MMQGFALAQWPCNYPIIIQESKQPLDAEGLTIDNAWISSSGDPYGPKAKSTIKVCLIIRDRSQVSPTQKRPMQGCFSSLIPDEKNCARARSRTTNIQFSLAAKCLPPDVARCCRCFECPDRRSRVPRGGQPTRADRVARAPPAPPTPAAQSPPKRDRN